MPIEQPAITTNKVKRFSLRLALVLLMFFVVLSLLFLLTNEIIFEKENDFDTTVFNWLNFNSVPQARSLMLFFTFFGSAKFLFPSYLLLSALFFFAKKEKWQSLNITAIGLSSAGLLFFLKSLFGRARPAEQLLKNVAGYSYPSGHSFSSFTFNGILIYLLWQSSVSTPVKWIGTVVLCAFAVMVALSRVYFRVHYPSDVIAGFLLSLVWLTISYFVLVRFSVPEKLYSKMKKS